MKTVRERQQAANTKRKTDATKLWKSRRAEIVWLYQTQMWSHAQIGKYFGITQVGMTLVMKRLKVKSRGKGRRGKLHHHYKDGSHSVLYRQMIEKDECEKCKATTRLVIHHKNGKHQDNHLRNLQVLCESCHNSYHKRLWWAISSPATSTA